MATTAPSTVIGNLRLGQTDAAGVLYFASALELAHEAMEAHLESRGVGLARLLADGPHLPIVHVEGNFKSPLRVGDAFIAAVDSVELSRRSLVFHTKISGPGGRLVADISLTHACIDPHTGKGIALPSSLKSALAEEA